LQKNNEEKIISQLINQSDLAFKLVLLPAKEISEDLPPRAR
jgi:hypothetical protein